MGNWNDFKCFVYYRVRSAEKVSFFLFSNVWAIRLTTSCFVHRFVDFWRNRRCFSRCPRTAGSSASLASPPSFYPAVLTAKAGRCPHCRAIRTTKTTKTIQSRPLWQGRRPARWPRITSPACGTLISITFVPSYLCIVLAVRLTSCFVYSYYAEVFFTLAARSVPSVITVSFF